MATIGLKNLVYVKHPINVQSVITRLAPSISANVDIETADAVLDADDGTLYDLHPFKRGTITLNVDDLPVAFLKDALGVTETSGGIVVSAAEDQGSDLAIGFMGLKPDGTYRGVWLSRVKFKIPPEAYTTKGDSITFNTPTISGTIIAESAARSNGGHVWRMTRDGSRTEIESYLSSLSVFLDSLTANVQAAPTVKAGPTVGVKANE